MSLLRAHAILFSLTLLLASSGGAWADELDRFKAENELKAQKIMAEVKAALAQSRKLEGTDPAAARDVLRRVQSKLEDDVVLSNRQRTQLLQQVRDRLRAVIQAVRAQEAAAEAADKQAPKIKERRRYGEGKKDGPFSAAKDYYDSAKGQFDARQKIKYQREKGFLGALGEIDQSAAILGEQRITKRFIMSAERGRPKLTAKEKALLKALNSVLSVDFNNTPFREVIDILQERTHQTIILDPGSLKEAMVESDDTVTFKAKKITVRTILRKVLGDKGLTYIIKEGALQVVTPQKARELMVVRVYPIADLINYNPQWGFFGQIMAIQNIQALIQTIQTSVDPAIWQQGANITFYPPTMSLLIRAPAEIHYSLGGYGAAGTR